MDYIFKKNRETISFEKLDYGFGLVVERVANCRVRVGSGYQNLGSGSGITLNLKPGTRVPSGIKIFRKYEKMTPA